MSEPRTTPIHDWNALRAEHGIDLTEPRYASEVAAIVGEPNHSRKNASGKRRKARSSSRTVKPGEGGAS